MFDHSKFIVELTIERVTRIPYSSGSVYVKWNVTDSPRPDAHGRTPSREVKDTDARFEYHTHFKQRIGLRSPSKLLRNCNIKFEVIWEPIGSRGVAIGTLNLDLAQFVQTHIPEKHKQLFNSNASSNTSSAQEEKWKQDGPAYGKTLMYLLSGARNNCLLEVNLKLDYVSGPTDYKPLEFDGPAMNYSLHDTNDAAETLNANLNGAQRGRDKVQKLQQAAFNDILNEDHVHNKAESEWLDFDAFLMGKNARLVSNELDKELERCGIRDKGTGYDTDTHRRGMPFLETEIRENFINWSVMSSADV